MNLQLIPCANGYEWVQQMQSIHSINGLVSTVQNHIFNVAENEFGVAYLQWNNQSGDDHGIPLYDIAEDPSAGWHPDLIEWIESIENGEEEFYLLARVSA